MDSAPARHRISLIGAIDRRLVAKRDRFDLDELVGPSQHGDAQERARRPVGPVHGGVLGPGCEQIVARGRSDEDRRLEQVRGLTAGVFESDLEVGERLASLRSDITRGHDAAVLVERAGARGEHEPNPVSARGVVVGDPAVKASTGVKLSHQDALFVWVRREWLRVSEPGPA